jgi:DNA-binding NarL/FixJ family response regulator
VAVCTYDIATALPDLSVSIFERADHRHVLAFHESLRAIPIALRRSLLALDPTVLDAQSEYVDKLPVRLRADICRMTPLVIMATTGDGGCLSIAFGDPTVRKWPPARIHRLRALAKHLAVAWRTRTVLYTAGIPPRAAAELHTDVSRTSLIPGASIPTAREALRRAVLAWKQAQTGRRSASGQELWPALVAGRWSLLDAFTGAGMRYIVAFENPAEAATLRALSLREQSVLELTLAGRSGKWIGLELRLSESAVTRTLRTALRRIGVADAATLAGVRTARFHPLEGLNLGVDLALAQLTPAAPSQVSLSDAERAIVTSILDGKRVAAIAQERGTSIRTVAHQITSTYKKLGISSRRELLALLT